MSPPLLPEQPPKRFVTAGSHRVCYVEGGRPELPTALLLHGWIASHALYRRVWAELGELFHFYALDLVGFGDSDKPDPESVAYDPPFYAEQLLAFVDAIGLKDPFHLVAQSMGGMAATEFTVRHPERVRRLVLIDSAGIEVPPPLLGMVLQAPVIGRSLFMALGGTRKTLDDFLKKDVYHQKDVYDPAVVDNMQRVLADRPGKLAAYATLTRMVAPKVYKRFSARFAEVRVPTAVIWGEHDKLFPLERCGRAIAGRIAGARLHVVKGSGHEPPVEQPAGFISALKDAIA
ncbi:MAG: alpha/beta hydrolase [Deltaproteobacteria bacterium]|nr:alpha/beta hydrolase [Deltaproteobacteria bacterium]